MNIKTVAKKWLIEHEHYEDESTFQSDLDSLCDAIRNILSYEGLVCDSETDEYDPKFGDEKVCECEHTYYRHFDPYEQMDPVGCKYCQCDEFVKKLMIGGVD
jgi:hypothetical protein